MLPFDCFVEVARVNADAQFPIGFDSSYHAIHPVSWLSDSVDYANLFHSIQFVSYFCRRAAGTLWGGWMTGVCVGSVLMW